MRQSEIDEFVATHIPPSGTLDVVAIVVHTPGEKIVGTDYPSGKGGRTQYGAGWFDSLKTSAPIGGLLTDQKTAMKLIEALKGEGSELWERKERRRRIIAEREAAEAAAETEEKAALKEAARLAKKSVHTLSSRERKKILAGVGSSRPSDSSEKHSDSTRMRLRVEEPTRS